MRISLIECSTLIKWELVTLGCKPSVMHFLHGSLSLSLSLSLSRAFPFWYSPLESVEPPLDDLPTCWAADLPKSISCWFPLGQSFCKWCSGFESLSCVMDFPIATASWSPLSKTVQILYSPSQPHRGDQAGSAHTVKAQAFPIPSGGGAHLIYYILRLLQFSLSFQGQKQDIHFFWWKYQNLHYCKHCNLDQKSV